MGRKGDEGTKNLTRQLYRIHLWRNGRRSGSQQFYSSSLDKYDEMVEKWQRKGFEVKGANHG